MDLTATYGHEAPNVSLRCSEGEMMRELELVSVVIPCYNQGHFLPDAIASVLRQTYPCFEIIVTDDGSTDDTAKIAAEHSAVRLIRQRNQGLAAARNAGLRASKGAFLVFLDADDKLLPEALETGIGTLKAHPECALAYGHVRLIDRQGLDFTSPHSITQIAVKRDHYLELLRQNYIWTPGVVMYRRTVFDAVGEFDPAINASADFDLHLRIARRFPVRCHNRVVLEYRIHGANMSSDPNVMLKHTMAVLRAQRRHVRGNRIYEEVLENGMRETQQGYGEALLRKVRSHVRDLEGRQAAMGIVALFQYYPQGLLKQVRKILYWKASRVFGR
jgi:glycosyltransferase involved in cell wall biosynthesis